MTSILQTTKGRFRNAYALALSLTILAAVHDLGAQAAGYQVGTKNLDLRTLPCRKSYGDDLCQPSGDVYLRVRSGNLVEIDTSWSEHEPEFITSPEAHGLHSGAVAVSGVSLWSCRLNWTTRDTK